MCAAAATAPLAFLCHVGGCSSGTATMTLCWTSTMRRCRCRAQRGGTRPWSWQASLTWGQLTPGGLQLQGVQQQQRQQSRAHRCQAAALNPLRVRASVGKRHTRSRLAAAAGSDAAAAEAPASRRAHIEHMQMCSRMCHQLVAQHSFACLHCLQRGREADVFIACHSLLHIASTQLLSQT